MASFRRFLRSSAALTAAPAAALFAVSTTTARLDAAPATDAASAPKQPVEFVGVFLTKDSAAQLKQQYPVKFATNNDDTLFLVLKYNPSEQEKDAFAPILGASAQLEVRGYVEDDTTQAVLVAVTTADGESLTYDSSAEHAHVQLSSAAGDANGLNSGYANVLLERLRANNQLQFLLDNDKTTESEWTGELPAFTSTHFPLYSPFPTTTATLVRVATNGKNDMDDKSKAPLLEGTVCLSSSYDAATGACVGGTGGKPECGFCKFMKAGPCGREFSAWEACLDKSKQSGGDFIELCSAPTLALRDCVDANPDYYSVLTEDAPANATDESGDDASMTM